MCQRLLREILYLRYCVSDSSSPSQTQNQTGTVTVKVNALPVVDFRFTNDNTCSGTLIQFFV